jgi:hypothetical protein
MSKITVLRHYLVTLPASKIVLWCYLIWYLLTVINYFDPSPAIWLNSLGISAVVGIALLLSVNAKKNSSPDRWQTFRLFFTPFAVSSFSSLIKGHGFILVFPPTVSEFVVSVASCTAFILLVLLLRHANGKCRI